MLRKPESQQPDSEQLITLLTAQHPDLAEAIQLAQGFARIVRQRQPYIELRALEVKTWLEIFLIWRKVFWD